MDFLVCSSGDSGLLCVIFWEEVDSFECFLGESGLFCLLFGQKWTFISKICPKLWTILDTFGPWGGGAFAPLAPPPGYCGLFLNPVSQNLVHVVKLIVNFAVFVSK